MYHWVTFIGMNEAPWCCSCSTSQDRCIVTYLCRFIKMLCPRCLRFFCTTTRIKYPLYSRNLIHICTIHTRTGTIFCLLVHNNQNIKQSVTSSSLIKAAADAWPYMFSAMLMRKGTDSSRGRDLNYSPGKGNGVIANSSPRHISYQQIKPHHPKERCEVSNIYSGHNMWSTKCLWL